MKHARSTRRYSLLLLLCTVLLTLACVLSACGGDGEGTDTTAAETTGATAPAETTGVPDTEASPTETTGAAEETTAPVEETKAPETTEQETEAPEPQIDAVNADKVDYLLGEAINIKVYASHTNMTVSVYPADFTPGEQPAIYWAYLEGAEGQDKTIPASKYVELTRFPGDNKGNELVDAYYNGYLPAGEYKVILRDETTGEEKASDTFTILPAQKLENVNIALNMPVAGMSSSFDWESCGSAFINDGTDKGWASGFDRNTTPDAVEYITINLLDVYTINRVLLTPQMFWNGTTVFPENYEIQVSMDDETYITVASVTGDNDFDESVRVIDFEPIDALYVRFQATKLRKAASTGEECFMVELDEMEVYFATDDSMVPEAKPANGVMTDKKTYYAGDAVNMTVYAVDTIFSVQLLTADATPGIDAAIYWSYLEGNADQTVLIPLQTSVNVTTLGGNNSDNAALEAYYGETLPIGEYKLCLVNDATGEVVFTCTFSIVERPALDELPATYLATDKTEYAVGETVSIIVKGEEQSAWVGVYDTDGVVNDTPCFRWAYLEGLSSASQVMPQGIAVDLMTLPGHNTGNTGNPSWYDQATEYLPAGEYKVVLVSELTGAVLLEVTFTVA